MAPFDQGKELAARIPNARLLPLDSDNHLSLADGPAWPMFIEEARRFLAT